MPEYDRILSQINTTAFDSDETLTEEGRFISGGLDYEVEKVKLHTLSEDGTQETEFYAIQRTDTKEVLAPCKERYKVLQNREVLDIIKSIVGDNAALSRCGSLHSGRKTYYFFKMGQINVNPRSSYSDSVNNYVYVLDSHDGSSRLTFGISSRVHSCSNMFSILGKSASFKIKHTANAEERAREAAILWSELKDMTSGFNNIMQRFESLKIDNSIRPVIESKLIGKLLGNDYDNLSNKLKKRHMEIRNSISRECSSKGDNLWGIFNGFTYYANHVMSHVDRENGDMESILIGTRGKLMSHAYEICVDYLDRVTDAKQRRES